VSETLEHFLNLVDDFDHVGRAAWCEFDVATFSLHATRAA